MHPNIRNQEDLHGGDTCRFLLLQMQTMKINVATKSEETIPSAMDKMVLDLFLFRHV
jgi:hypothetical protein